MKTFIRKSKLFNCFKLLKRNGILVWLNEICFFFLLQNVKTLYILLTVWFNRKSFFSLNLTRTTVYYHSPNDKWSNALVGHPSFVRKTVRKYKAVFGDHNTVIIIKHFLYLKSTFRSDRQNSKSEFVKQESFHQVQKN